MDEIKYVINELNSKFGKKLNVISYDSLRGEQRLEILFKVFKAIDPTINVESLEVAEPEEVVVRILEMLRVFKYLPPLSVDASSFRAGVIIGDRNVMTHILSYLLLRLDDLKKRAYLARFLVKIEVSADIEGDNDVITLYQQYEQLITNFKAMHTLREKLEKNRGTAQEIQKDLKAMEEEKEQVSQKLSNIKMKVDSNSHPELFLLVKEFRDEKEKNEKMTQQNVQQESTLKQLNQHLSRITNHLKDVQNTYQSGSTPREMLEKMEEEINTKKHLVDEVLPKEMDSIQRYVQDLEEIESQPSVGPEFLDKINLRMQNINREINVIVEKRMLHEDPMDDKLALFKQNAALVAKKRETLKAKLSESEAKLNRMKQELEEAVHACDGEEILKGDALKVYVIHVRNKGGVYRQKRQEAAELRTEAGIYSRTVMTLKKHEEQMLEVLGSLEDNRGISGYFAMQEENMGKKEEDRQDFEEKNAEEIADAVKRINMDINDKKAALAPIIKDLRPLRQQCQDLTHEHDQKKAGYDSIAAGLESNVVSLEQEVKRLQDQVIKLESSQYKFKCQLEVLEAQEAMINEEMKYFISTDPEDKSKSLLEKVQKELQSEQILSDDLKQKQKSLKENESATKKQLKMWKDLQALLKVKKRCLQKSAEKPATTGTVVKDHLVL